MVMVGVLVSVGRLQQALSCPMVVDYNKRYPVVWDHELALALTSPPTPTHNRAVRLFTRRIADNTSSPHLSAARKAGNVVSARSQSCQSPSGRGQSSMVLQEQEPFRSKADATRAKPPATRLMTAVRAESVTSCTSCIPRMSRSIVAASASRLAVTAEERASVSARAMALATRPAPTPVAAGDT